MTYNHKTKDLRPLSNRFSVPSFWLSVLSFLLLVLSFLFIAPSAQAGTILKSPAYLGLQRGLVGCWNFDGAYTKAQDCSGNNNTGTLTNGPTKAKGKIGQALTFDGVNDYVDFPNESTFDFSNTTFTVTGWINSSSSGGGCTGIVSKNDGNDGGWLVCANSSKGLTVLIRCNVASCDSATRATANTIIKDTGWHHFAAIITTDTVTTGNNTITIYMDGELDQGTLNQLDTYDANNTTVKIGNRTSSAHWKGSADDIRIYNRALSATEIQRLYRISLGSTTNRTSTSSSWSKGLVGHWTFDGVDTHSSNKTDDKSGQGNHGTMTNGPIRKPGRIGQALNFDGVNDYVEASPLPSSVYGSNPRTISFWFKADAFDTSTNDRMISLAKTGGAGTQFKIYAEDNGISIAFNFDRPAFAANTLLVGRWYHAVVVVPVGATSTGDVLGYIDGVAYPQSGGTPQTLNTTSTDNLTFGASDSGGEAFDGLLDDIRIYNRALSTNEIQNLYQETQSKYNISQTDSLTYGLVGYWTLDGVDTHSSNKTDDKSGQGNHGTMTNGPIRKPGRIGQALNFDGSDDYVTVADPSSGILDFGTATNFTMSAWIKSDRPTAGIFGKRDVSGGTPTGYSFRVISNGLRMTLVNSSNSNCSVDSSIDPTTGSWKHVVAVVNRNASCTTSDIILYIDGVRDTATTVTSSSTNANANVSNSEPFLIGAIKESGVVSNFFQGYIDDARVYNRALSAGEIQKLYNLGR